MDTSVRLGAALVIFLTFVTVLSLPAHAQEPMGSGVGWIDCNLDGALDLVYLTPAGKVHMLMYSPLAKTFQDVTSTHIPVQASNSSHTGMAVVCGDVNNDGFPDLFLTTAGPNRLLLNDGTGKFTLVTRAAGIEANPADGEVLTASAAFLDYDNDGLLDIYVVNYEGHSNQLFHNLGIDGDGIPLYEDVAPAMGVDIAGGEASNWGLGVAVADYDNDGDCDLYVANDYNGVAEGGGALNPGRNVLYRNDGGTFVDVSVASGSDDPGWAMGVVFGDYNQDGHLDIFLANFWEDVLYHNNGDGTFTDKAVELGIQGPDHDPEEDGPTGYNGWGTTFFDYDNDGDMDIHVANGYITNDQGQVLNEPNELWENRGPNANPRFVEVGAAAGIDDVGDARGAAYGDLDRDGFVDMIVINNNYLTGPGVIEAPVRLLYINQGDGTFTDLGLSHGIRSEDPDGEGVPGRGDFSGNRWIQIAVEGSVSNRSAVGARVSVTVGGVTQIQDLGASSYCSTNAPYLHFGLGSRNIIDEVSVRFPSGTVITRTNVLPDQFLTLSEDDEVPVTLLAFSAAPTADGARVTWRYSDTGDLAMFALSRSAAGATTLLDGTLRGQDGLGSYIDRSVPTGEVTYHLDALYRDGAIERVGSTSFRGGTLPGGLVVGQNVPNPFRAATSIPLLGAPGSRATVDIFDTRGRLVRTLGATLADGRGSLSWDGHDTSGRSVSAGTYFYRVRGTEQTLKMLRRP